MQELNILDHVTKTILSASEIEFAEISITGMAYALNMDRTKLSRDFKRSTNINLEDFLFRERMVRAAFMLVDNDNITVKEVSKKIGYLTYDYFIRKFKEFYGITPFKYKELKTLHKFTTND